MAMRPDLETQARGEMFRDGQWAKDSDNYGKLDRLYDEGLRQFRDNTWSLDEAGKTLKEWQAFIKK